MTIKPPYEQDAKLHFGHFEIRRVERQLHVAGMPAALGSRAFDVLLALCDRADRVVPKHELIDLVWPGLIVEENNLQVQISSLRKLLGREVIATIPGRGYQFTAAHTTPSPTTPLHDAGAEMARRESPRSSAIPAASGSGNLPEILPLLYGRNDDVAALDAMVTAHRLITLVGAGGIGKTRLAQTVALAQLKSRNWTDGVWFVELAPCTDPALVPSVIAQTLGIKLIADKSAQDELLSALRGVTLLLVLDNCEHLLDACAEFATAVLAQTSGVKLLATSQEALHLPDEQQFRAKPLAIPVGATDAGASEAGAVALFAARARSADPRFELHANNLEAVIEICRRLDGIALAIELAAARVPLLGVDGVRARLDDRFKVLTAGARVALRRHQTLRATVEWSHSLLSEAEQAVLRRIGVFVGSFALSCAQYVAADVHIDEWAALDHLGALVEKSWVVVESSAEPRYRLLETMRAFALEKLLECGETAITLRRHAEAMHGLFDISWHDRWTLSAPAKLNRYWPDIDNLRAALDWASGDSDSSELLIEMTAASGWLWFTAAYMPEAVRRYNLALDRRGETTPPATEASLLYGFSVLSDASPPKSFIEAIDRSITLYRSLGDTAGLFLALTRRSQISAHLGQADGAERFWRAAEALMDHSWPAELRSRLITAKTHYFWFRGELQHARSCNAEALALAHEARDESSVISALIFAEQIASSQGNLQEAVENGREILTRDHGRFTRGKSLALGNLSAALTELGQIDEALSTARECVPIKTRDGSLWVRLDAFALLASKRDHAKSAALVLGCSDAIYATKKHPRQPNEQRVRDLALAGLQKAFSKRELNKLLAEGATLSVEAAARIALAD